MTDSTYQTLMKQPHRHTPPLLPPLPPPPPAAAASHSPFHTSLVLKTPLPALLPAVEYLSAEYIA